ncbi:MAG: HlyD family type I secretion periplasmic adaptor subunit [Bradyrhizobium sp.]|uniref:HlyD family type I secretion periplasmic adaptor subunit n=1 Tax=Bradyrhizobium sp. TaxID=376 RepID=UPI001C29FB10|nr:HlyD family type I secretion periplasmic adaptor subunit [Bradyrhizobium sp.]MBU6463050.1 HlyD family type I secretion periplasmic adaptor subunit [Pseudomonadota bacterium]MDE2069250.1 HlyD family type I secretion periplasmic adaptor subunit [Bradyrhizobium sp.]
MASANNSVVSFPKRPIRHQNYELAFLPAALEIAETPPSPVGRAVGATIIAIFCVALLWATFGKVDIVATATGKIIPSGRTKLIQPLETGVVRAIRVHEGQQVHAGESLIELDPTMTAAEQGHVTADLIAARLEVARLQAMLADGDPLANFHPPAGATAAQIEMHRQFLISQTAEQRARLAELDRQTSQKDAERQTVEATIAKLEATIPPLQERTDTRKYLSDKGLGSKMTYLSDYQDLVGQQQDLLIQRSRLKEAEAALAALKETRERTAAEFRRTLYDELAKAEQKSAGGAQDEIKADRRTKLHDLLAPVDGVVQQLAVHTIGGVVTPAQVLAVVVPQDSHLEIEATLANDDVGFVHAGQDAEIKVHTFNYTRYGVLHGKVLSVSPDTIARDGRDVAEPRTHAEGPAGNSQQEPDDLVYAARVSLDEHQLQAEDRVVELGPGMAVTVEMKTGSRRIIDYLLSPLAKYEHEALRER